MQCPFLESRLTDLDTHYRACNLCEAICGLEIALDGDKVVSIKGDRADPFSRGHICPKAVALMDIQNDPDRLRGPVKRIGKGAQSEWIGIGWDQAIKLVSTRIAEIHRLHGPDAIASYQGNPSVHNYGLMTHASHFLGSLKTRNRFSATSTDQLPHQLVCFWMYGHQLLVPVPDIDHTGHMLMLGANPMASNGSMMTVPDVANRLKAVQQRGGKLVVIDPRRTETALVADEHHFIRPGSDAAFLFALLHTIFEEDLARPGRLSPMLEDLDLVRGAIKEFTPETAARATGIGADAIRRMAREFAAAPRAACYGRLGVSAQQHGTLCQWAIQLLNIVTGNLDRVGGSLVTTPAVDVLAGTRPGSHGRWVSRVRRLPEVNGELPASAMAEEMLTPGAGQVKAFITIAGNPVLSTPNGPQLELALNGLDFMVSLDMYINETTRFADVILPSTSALEHDHYDLIFNLLAVRNVARYNSPALPKPEGSLHDWEILERLGNALALELGQDPRPMLAPRDLLDFGLQTGPCGNASPHKLSLKKLEDNPHGIDLGPLAPSFPERLMTEGQAIHCAPRELMEALSRSKAVLLAEAPPDQIVLIGRRHVRSNNSWMHNSDRLVRGRDRSAMLAHPDDLARFGLQPGENARVASRTGEVLIEAQPSQDIMRGVVSIPHGWGHHREGIRMEIAARHAGVSANDLTDDQAMDVVSGNAALNGVVVRVEKPG
ncbi:MAG: molybdopterin-dependent oxidoreductase [Holophagaceae bacterium]|nr:molybdopterin-dependent oxidoreductase [Holophagaceae bacterium]